jgi:hypothetical protein
MIHFQNHVHIAILAMTRIFSVFYSDNSIQLILPYDWYLTSPVMSLVLNPLIWDTRPFLKLTCY